LNNAKWIAACAVLMAAGAVSAQTLALPQPQNVLQLSANSTVEVQQDQLSMTLSTSRDAVDAATVQTQLKTALDAALAEARKNAQPGQMDVRTGNFHLSPLCPLSLQERCSLPGELAASTRAGGKRLGR